MWFHRQVRAAVGQRERVGSRRRQTVPRRVRAAESLERRDLLAGAAELLAALGPQAAALPAALEIEDRPAVVFTEIMYHPDGDDVREEFLEIYNRSSQDVELTGWRLSRGVTFTFPQTTLPANSYLVIAADLDRFRERYPNVTNVVGDWSGRLSNQGENVEMVDASGVVVDHVRYADQGDWAIRVEGELDRGHRGWEWRADHDGEGKSLELLNWQMPNQYGMNWAASQPMGGTPGRANSVATQNAPPVIAGVQHHPPIPRSTDPITVTATLADEADVLMRAEVVYRRDGESTEHRQPLSDSGTQGDTQSGDGVYSAQLPAQPHGTRLQFRIEVVDLSGQARVWPLAEPGSGGTRPDALLTVSDTFPLAAQLEPGDQPIHHMIMTAAERDELADIGDGPLDEASSNAAMNATLIHVSGAGVEVRYLVSVRNRGGASRIGPPNNYRVEFPHDQPWQGITAVNFNCQYVHSQILGSAVFRAAGIPAAVALPVKVFINDQDAAEPAGPRMFGSFAQVEVIDGDFVDEHFPDDSNGNLYRAVTAGPQSADLRDEGPDPDAYRDTYLKRTNEADDDWSDLLRLIDVLHDTPDGEFVERMAEVIDIDQWLRMLALDSLLGNRETGLSSGSGDNYWLYRGVEDPRFKLIPHDLDTLMGKGRVAQPNASIFSYTATAGLRRLLTHPDLLPRYYRAFIELIDQQFNPERLNPLFDQLLGGFVPEAEARQLKQFVVDRFQGVMAQMPHEFVVTSPLPLVDGWYRTTSPFAEVEGTAYAVETRSIVVNGQLADWSPVTRVWSIRPRGEGRTEVLIAENSQWKYLADGSDQQTRWRNVDADDRAWPSGAAPLGYGVGDEATQVSFGPNVNDKYITSYFRRTFEVQDPEQILDAVLRLQVDDGAIVYLNGQEVERIRMPGGPVNFQTLANQWIGTVSPNTYQSMSIDPQLFRPGTNVLAVEVHQRSPVDNDLRLNASLETRIGQLTGGVPLNPGVNRVRVQAMNGPDGTGDVVDEGFIDIWYDGSRPREPVFCDQLRQEGRLLPTDLGGVRLNSDMMMAPCGPAYQIDGEVVVPAGVTLTILPGTTLFFGEDGGIVVDQGRLVADGEPSAPIRFTRSPDHRSWRGIQFLNTTENNRIAHAVLEYGVTDDGMVGLDGSKLWVENAYFDHTRLFRIRTVNSSLVVKDSTFTDIYGPDEEPTTDNRSEHLWGSGIMEGGELLLVGNWFGSTKGHNDSIDFDGALRPGPIPRIIDNIFAGGGDDALDLETDAHIEGNLFFGIHKDEFNSSTGDANAISAGDGREYVVVRNVFYDVDHAVQVKDEAFLTFDHNTVVSTAQSAIYFQLDERGPGRGALVTDSIFHDVQTAFDALGPQTQLQVHRSIVPLDALAWGHDNLVGDPRLRDVQAHDFALRPGSPAARSGLFGSDRGAEVVEGPWVGGVPEQITSRRDFVLSVGGSTFLAYRFRIDGQAWSEPRSLTQAIRLSGLADGEHTLEVVGQDSSGTWQSLQSPAVSFTWTVDTRTERLRLSEISAGNPQAPSGGSMVDWIELHNAGTTRIDLSGMSLTDDPAQPRKFIFPAGSSIEPGAYLVVVADDQPHAGHYVTGFRLDAEGESVALFDRTDRGGGLIDRVDFGLQLDDFSIGRTGRDETWTLNRPTPGFANVAAPTGDPAYLVIDEWLARPGARVGDEYVELYNPDSLPVELSGLVITDDPVAYPRRHTISNLSFIAGGGVARLITDRNLAAGPNHVDFELNGDHEILSLYLADGRLIDQVVTLQQVSGISEGRSPSGSSTTRHFVVPTPGATNPVPQVTELDLIPFAGVWRYYPSDSMPAGDWYQDDYDDADWEEAAGSFGAGAEPEGHPVVTTLPLGRITYYFRRQFELPPEAIGQNVDLTTELVTLIDDGALIYVNGTPVLRMGLPDGPVTHETRANRGVGVAAEEGPFAIPAGLLRPGLNTIAVEVHQISPTSSDVNFDLKLRAFVSNRDPLLANAERLLSSLRITEVMYHPSGNEEAEFVEVQNAAAESIRLSGVRLEGGVEFVFPDVELRPQEYAVIVRNRPVFEQVYGTSLRVLGEYSNQLGNGSDPLSLRLPAPLDVDIMHAYYEDEWYPSTDGSGYSIVAVDEPAVPLRWESRGDWRASQRAGGSPGRSDDGRLIGDFNGDGLLSAIDVNLLGSAVAASSSELKFDVNADGRVDLADMETLLPSVFFTGTGDVNLDGRFNSSDLVSIFQAGLYGQGPIPAVTWTAGDWNCDGQFDSADLVYAFQTNAYEG